MEYDPIFNDIPWRRLTYLAFPSHVLIQGGDSGIAYWNPADPTQIIPWRINRSVPRLTRAYVVASNHSVNTGIYSALHLWAVDQAGADLFQMNYLTTDPAPPPPQAGTDESANGLVWRLDNPGAGQTWTVDVGDPCGLLWDFLNEDQTARVAVPLMPS